MLKKLIIGLAVLTMLIPLTAQIASAEDTGSADAKNSIPTPAPAAPTTPSTSSDTSAMESFKVSDYLTVPSLQGQSYLKNDSSPISSFILMIIDTLLMVIGTVCMVLIIIGGVLMMSSQGDDSRIQKGKTILTQAIIGLIFAFTSYILVTFVQSLLYA